MTQALAKYWTFVQRITESLSKPGVQKHLGAAYKPLFEASLRFFEVSHCCCERESQRQANMYLLKESSEKLITTIASELDEEEAHHKEKSPWDMSLNDAEEEEVYQTEGQFVSSCYSPIMPLTTPRNPACLD